MAERVTAIGAATSLADRKRRAGQRMVIGVGGHALSAEERSFIREIQPAGFVLFGRNVAEPAQVVELNRELAASVDPSTPALLAVDQEGGRVQRIRDSATSWPSLEALGRAPREVRDVARGLAREVRALGFNINFAPVADVLAVDGGGVIGDRSFGADPEEVARLVAAFVTAHQEVGVAACAKHFPGHGGVAADSHVSRPVDERDLPELLHASLPPFRAAAKAGVGAVMTAHVVYPAWDEAQPATLSARVVPEVLRGLLGYDGVVVSDDLSMGALRGVPLDEVARRATDATVDLLLYCPPLDAGDGGYALYRELVRCQEDDPAQDRSAGEAVRRVHALRERFLLDRPPAPGLEVLGALEHRVLARRVSDRDPA